MVQLARQAKADVPTQVFETSGALAAALAAPKRQEAPDFLQMGLPNSDPPIPAQTLMQATEVAHMLWSADESRRLYGAIEQDLKGVAQRNAYTVVITANNMAKDDILEKLGFPHALTVLSIEEMLTDAKSAFPSPLLPMAFDLRLGNCLVPKPFALPVGYAEAERATFLEYHGVPEHSHEALRANCHSSLFTSQGRHSRKSLCTYSSQSISSVFAWTGALALMFKIAIGQSLKLLRIPLRT